MLLNVSDAGGGDGTWQVELHPQSASTGASLDVSPMVIVAPGRQRDPHRDRASASADAVAGDDYGFLVLRRGSDTRRDPVRLLRRPARPRRRYRRPAQDRPDRATRARARTASPSTAGRPSRSDRPRATRGPGDGREGQGASLRDDADEERGQLRRRGPVRVVRVARRPVAPLGAGREHRPGLRGHAGERQRDHDRLPGRRRSRRGGVRELRAATTSPSTRGATR